MCITPRLRGRIDPYDAVEAGIEGKKWWPLDSELQGKIVRVSQNAVHCSTIAGIHYGVIWVTTQHVGGMRTMMTTIAHDYLSSSRNIGWLPEAIDIDRPFGTVVV